MKINDAITTALRGIRQGKVRSALTMLGIVIGISSVILLMSIGASAQQYIIGEVNSLGSNLIYILPGGTGGSRFSAPAAAQGIIVKTLVERDAASLAREPGIIAVAPLVRGQARAIYDTNDTTVTWQASTPVLFKLNNLTLSRGYPFTDSDLGAYNRVAVIGSSLATKLFEGVDPLGKSIRLKDITFRVVGVLNPKGVGAGGIDQDNMVVVPLSVGQHQLLGINYFQQIAVQGADNYDSAFLESRVVSILRENHGVTDPNKDDFTVRTQQDALNTLNSITSVLTLFLTAIAAISLVVGGIGIMNIMLVSVTERTREIGLRKALGATERDLLTQFLVEAVILTSLGGVIGILGGTLFVTLAYFGVKYGAGIDWAFQLPLNSILMAVSVSVLTGLTFGVYPARQAARKNPIDALRYE